MEHFKSTIATTAVLVMGLVTAAHVLHPRDPASEARRATSLVAKADTATAWSDPPVRVQVAATDAVTPRPASFTVLPVAMTAWQPGIEDRPQIRHVRKADGVRGRRLAQRGGSNRMASIATGAELQTAKPVVTTAQAGRTSPGDPIGDLLKALGLGRGSEG